MVVSSLTSSNLLLAFFTIQTSLANMTTLPTFIELLSSLGLDEKGTPPPRGMSSGPDSNAMECTPSIQSPREPIVGNSPAIVIDAPDCVKVRSLGPSFRTRGARYAPYGAETVSVWILWVVSMNLSRANSDRYICSARKHFFLGYANHSREYTLGDNNYA